MRHRGRAAPWRLGVLASGLLAGCESAPPSAPAGDTLGTPAAISAAVSTIELALGTPALHSLFVSGTRMIIPGAVAPVLLTSSPSWCGPGRAAPLTPHLAPRTPPATLIADSLFGRAYAYDASSRSYQFASYAGPANGVRFLLDDLDNYGGYILPRTQVGWLDLTAAGSGGTNRMRVQVVSGPTLHADYLVTPSGSSSAYVALLAGLVSDHPAAFRFSDSIQVAGPEVNRLAVFDSAGHGVRITLRARKLNHDPADFLYEFDLLAMRGDTTIRLSGVNSVYCFYGSWSVSVTLNDSALATYTRGDGDTKVTPAAGRTLSSTESRVILDLMDLQQLLFEWLNALFMPVWRLLPP